MSKLKSKSMRPHFVVGREKKAGKGKDMLYKLVADVAGRTLAIENRKGELVAQMAKTKTALLKTAIYGGGSESTIIEQKLMKRSGVIYLLHLSHKF